MIKNICFMTSFIEFIQELLNSHDNNFSIYIDNGKSLESLSGEIEIINNTTLKIKNIVYQYESGLSHDFTQSKETEFALFDINTGKMIQDCYLHDRYCDGANGQLSEFLPSFFNDKCLLV
jgi:hypothetical protein